jgi:hypothetical protein
VKRTMLILAVFLCAIALAAETYPSLSPKNAKSMALGGSFTSIPTAEFSFFGNPAAFASPTASFTLLSVDAWAYIKPTAATIDTFVDSILQSNPLRGLEGLMPGNGGTGGGASLGFGYAGKGLALGAFATSDAWAAGDGIPGSALKSDTEVSAVIGLGARIGFLGGSLSFGGDLRPFYRVRTEIPLSDLDATLSAGGDAFDDLDLKACFGLAMDLGATWQLGDFGIGLAVRDIAPSFPISTTTFQELLDSLKNGSLPDASVSAGNAVFLPNVTAGLSWKPRLLPGLVEPAFYLELQDPVAVAANWDGFGSALNLLHVGAEVRLLSIFTLRGGLNRGWLSAGAGLGLGFIDLNAAVFTEELGAVHGDLPRSGISLQAALRF